MDSHRQCASGLVEVPVPVGGQEVVDAGRPVRVGNGVVGVAAGRVDLTAGAGGDDPCGADLRGLLGGGAIAVGATVNEPAGVVDDEESQLRGFGGDHLGDGVAGDDAAAGDLTRQRVAAEGG